MTDLRFAIGDPVRRNNRRAVVYGRSFVSRRYDIRFRDGECEQAVPEGSLRLDRQAKAKMEGTAA